MFFMYILRCYIYGLSGITLCIYCARLHFYFNLMLVNIRVFLPRSLCCKSAQLSQHSVKCTNLYIILVDLIRQLLANLVYVLL